LRVILSLTTYSTTAISTLSLHDALPIFLDAGDVVDVLGDDVHADALGHAAQGLADAAEADDAQGLAAQLEALAVGLLLPLALAPDRKSTRLNSSHVSTSYAVFCLRKKAI